MGFQVIAVRTVDENGIQNESVLDLRGRNLAKIKSLQGVVDKVIGVKNEIDKENGGEDGMH